MNEASAIPCIDPARGEVFAHSLLTAEAEVAGLIGRSRQAQAEWAALPLRRRLAACLRLRDQLMQEADAIAAVISRDNGKTRVDAMSTEVFPSLLALSYYMKKAPAFLRDSGLGLGNLLLINKRSRLAYHPYGVVGVISPWNYPFAIPFSDVVMGLRGRLEDASWSRVFCRQVCLLGSSPTLICRGRAPGGPCCRAEWTSYSLPGQWPRASGSWQWPPPP
jgi:acyl-CoA reductase-like NAD-dependent aldehyde dehydrogenase